MAPVNAPDDVAQIEVTRFVGRQLEGIMTNDPDRLAFQLELSADSNHLTMRISSTDALEPNRLQGIMTLERVRASVGQAQG
jgi:hypothetical protein